MEKCVILLPDVVTKDLQAVVVGIEACVNTLVNRTHERLPRKQVAPFIIQSYFLLRKSGWHADVYTKDEKMSLLMDVQKRAHQFIRTVYDA